MSYQEIEEEVFHYFSEEEKKEIEEFLKSKGYKWDTNTVCGSCCGMYADEYWVDGIGGNFRDEDKKELAELCNNKKIYCSIGRYTISADPNDEDEYRIDD